MGGSPPVGVAGQKRDEPVYGREVDGNHLVSVECRHMDIDKRWCGERHNNWPETSAHPELGRASQALDWLLEVANLGVSAWMCTCSPSKGDTDSAK